MGIKIPKMGKPKVNANQPFRRAFQGVKNAGTQTREAFDGTVPLTTAFRNGNAIAAMRESGEGAAYKWGDKSLSWKKMGAAAAGTYVAGDTAFRGISGGSLYRNNDGQRDIVGVPII